MNIRYAIFDMPPIIWTPELLEARQQSNDSKQVFSSPGSLLSKKSSYHSVKKQCENDDAHRECTVGTVSIQNLGETPFCGYETWRKQNIDENQTGQHHAHMITKGLLGKGNILIFDNDDGPAKAVQAAPLKMVPRPTCVTTLNSLISILSSSNSFRNSLLLTGIACPVS